MKHPNNGLSQNYSHLKNENRDELFKGRTHHHGRSLENTL